MTVILRRTRLKSVIPLVIVLVLLLYLFPIKSSKADFYLLKSKSDPIRAEKIYSSIKIVDWEPTIEPEVEHI